MKEPSSRLEELVGVHHSEASLNNDELRELETILAKDESAREYYVLTQELQTMLEVEKTIRLQLASDQLPANVIAMPGLEASQIEFADEPPMLNQETKRKAAVGFRMATSIAAMVAGLLVVYFMSTVVSDLPIFAENGGNNNGIANPTDQAISYHKEVLPILRDHCFTCHGENEDDRKAGLRLDIASEATGGDDPAIVPGSPQKSELVARISSRDPDYMMPPPEQASRLSKVEAETLTDWIQQGAHYSNHWSSYLEDFSKPLESLATTTHGGLN